MKRLQKKFLLIFLYLFFTVIIALFCYPYVQNLSTPDGRIQIQEKITGYGLFAPLLYILLQVLHIVIACIPGEPIEILGGVLFGIVGGLCYALAGVLIGTTLVFLLVRKFGKPIAQTFFTEEKMQKYRILRDEKRLESLVFLLFLIPGTPKDLLTYLVPLTKIESWKYLLIATFARIPSIITSVFVGASIGDGHFVLSLLIFVLTAAIGMVGIWFNGKITRTSDASKKGKSQ